MSKAYTIVTGASEGLGRCFAEAFARRGSNLVIVARDEARLEQSRRELEATHGIRVVVVAQDLGDLGAAAAIQAAVGDRPVSCLVNNAGFQVPMGPFRDGDPAAIREMVAVNILALSDLTHAFLPAIVAARGTIVNVASHAAFQPVPYMAAYAASKAYVLHFTEALQSELDDSDPGAVHVLALCPGATRTRFWERSGSPVEDTLFPVMKPEDVVAKAMRNLDRRGRTVLIPSALLSLSTQSLRFSTRSLNRFMAKKLVGH